MPHLQFGKVVSKFGNMKGKLNVKSYKVVVKDSSPIIFARPKSASLTDKFLSARRIFSGLISR